MGAAERSAAERVEEELVLAPQEGPQTALLESDADITFFGGQAGGGKTFAALLALVRWFQVLGYAGILFRRQAVDLVGAESAWEQSKRIMGALGGVPRESPSLSWRWTDHRSSIEFRHLQHADDVLDHMGKAYACIVFEEVTHFLESQFWYLVSRLRSTCGVRPHVIATCNPDPDSFVAKLVAWWIDQATGLPIESRCGVKRWFVRRDDDSFDWADAKSDVEARNPGKGALSVTFIASKLTDNPHLTRVDPEYATRLDALPLVERQRLKEGRWSRGAASGDYFRDHWFPRIALAPVPKRVVRAWDLAATAVTRESPDPDWTRGLKVSRYNASPPLRMLPPGAVLPEDQFAIVDRKSARSGPAEVEKLIFETAVLDGHETEIAFWQDPGQAGKAQAHALAASLGNMGYAVHTVLASRDKTAYARVWSPLCEKGRVSVLEADWTDDLMRLLGGFPGGRYLDDVDAGSLAFQVLTGAPPVRSFRMRGL